MPAENTDSRSSMKPLRLLTNRSSRRDFIRRSMAVGAGVPIIASILAACGSSSSSTSSSSNAGSTSSASGSSSTASPTTTSVTVNQNVTNVGSEATPSATTSGAVAGRAGGSLTFLRSVDATTTDPVQWQNPEIWPFSSIYDKLINIADDGLSLVPSLAERWEASQDGLTYTFHLRQGVKFYDGSTMTSDDAVWSIKRAQADTTGGWAFTLSQVKDVTNPDPNTVVITLKQIWAPFLSDISLFNSSVISKAFGEKVGTSGLQTQAMGTGPFYLKEWQRGDHITLAKNTHYWQPGLPYLDEVTFKEVPNTNSQILEVQGGQADGIIGQNDVPFNRIADLSKDSKLQVLKFTSTYINYVTFNTKHAPLDDVKFRQALNYATDVNALIKTILYGNGEVANSFMPNGALYWNKDQAPYPFDLDKAKQLMSQSKTPNSAKFGMLISSGNVQTLAVATALKAMWAKINVDLDIQQLASSVARQKISEAGDYDSTVTGWTNDIIDPDELVSFSIFPASSHDYHTYWEDPQAIKLAQDAEATMDPAKRRDLYYQLQAIHKEAAVMVYLYVIPFVNVLSTRVKGFVQPPMGQWVFTNTYIEK